MMQLWQEIPIPDGQSINILMQKGSGLVFWLNKAESNFTFVGFMGSWIRNY